MPGTFLLRCVRVTLVLLLLPCLVVAASAQHGGRGGGHGGGGHSGGGHGGGHSGGHSHAGSGHSNSHWSWLHFWSRQRGGSAENSPNDLDGGMLGVTRGSPFRAHRSTDIRAVLLPSRMLLTGDRFSTYSRFKHRREYLYGGFRHFRGAVCYFNGFNQICGLEPTWPLFFFSAGFDWFPFDFGYDDSGDIPDISNSTDTTTAPEAESEAPDNNATKTPRELLGQGLDPRFFLLILKHGTDLVVTDYWLADGYIEYISRDGSRSHIPVDALDLQETVTQNSARGLSFVLRSTP